MLKPLSRACLPPPQAGVKIPRHEESKKILRLLDGIAFLLVQTLNPMLSRQLFYTNTKQHNSIKIEFARNSAVKIPADYINKILSRLALLTFSDDRNIAASKNACKKVLPREVTEEKEEDDDSDQFIRGLFVEFEGVQNPKAVSNFFKRLLSFSKELRPVTEKKDRAIWVIFFRSR